VASLDNHAIYHWRIEARDGRGGRASSPTWVFLTEPVVGPNLPPSPPRAPITPPDGSITSRASAVLTWSGGDDPDGDPVTFDVRFGTTTPPSYLASVTTKQLLVEDLAYSTEYFWQIVARDDHQHAVEGPVWQFFTPEAPSNLPPSAPCDPVPLNGATGVPIQVTLTWGCGDDPDGDPVEYVVFLEENDGSDPDSVATVSEKSYWTELDYGAVYYWRIEARDGRGGNVSSPIWVFESVALGPPNEPPSAPCDPDPLDGEIGVPIDLTLSWGCGDDPDGDPVQYIVYLAKDDGSDPDSVAAVTEKSYTTTLEYEATYYWRIEARDGRGGVASSGIWSFITEPDPANEPPSVPCDPSPRDGRGNISRNPNLRWSCGEDPDGDPVIYTVFFGKSEDPPFLTTTTEREYRVRELERDETYYWRIVAEDDHGHATTGPVWSFTTR
jgi:hypothetical protein